MDNVTHALVGAAMAECAMPRHVSPQARRIFFAAGVMAANAPDVDLVYTGLTEAPLGYLLHHRGHSHTLPGLAALASVMFVAMQLWPAGRSAIRGLHTRWILLIAAALLSHLLMDAANSYGTHLYYPISSRWYFGDAVFVLEPWVWLLLGIPLAVNARHWGWRGTIWLATVGPILALSSARLIPFAAVAILAVAGLSLVVIQRSWHPRQRATAALSSVAAVFLILLGLSRVTAQIVRQAVEPSAERQLIDLVLNPNPGVPWCWSALVLERDDTQRALVTRRGTLSLLPGGWPVSRCASNMLFGSGEQPVVTSGGVVWEQSWKTDIDELQRLYATNCRVRAWLQFGRVPFVHEGRVVDLRFTNSLRGSFSEMTIASAAATCPAHLTGWQPPRSDILLPAARP